MKEGAEREREIVKWFLVEWERILRGKLGFWKIWESDSIAKSVKNLEVGEEAWDWIREDWRVFFFFYFKFFIIFLLINYFNILNLGRNFFLIFNFHVYPLMTHGAQSMSTWAPHHQLTGDLTARLKNIWDCPKINTLGMTLGWKKLHVLNVENHETWG